jgi:hypothetical protein
MHWNKKANKQAKIYPLILFQGWFLFLIRVSKLPGAPKGSVDRSVQKMISKWQPYSEVVKRDIIANINLSNFGILLQNVTGTVFRLANISLKLIMNWINTYGQQLYGPAVSALRRTFAEAKQRSQRS